MSYFYSRKHRKGYRILRNPARPQDGFEEVQIAPTDPDIRRQRQLANKSAILIGEFKKTPWADDKRRLRIEKLQSQSV